MSALANDPAPLVLVENADPAATVAQVAALTAAGLRTRVCPGPDALGDDRCQLVSTGYCHLVDDADVVLHDLDLDDPEDRQILLDLRGLHPQLPVVVEASVSTARRYRHMLDGCTVVPPYSPEQLTYVIQGVVGRSRSSPV